VDQRERARWDARITKVESGCWVFAGTQRYPQFMYRRRVWSAHRLAWVLAFGEVPDNLHVCHRCDNTKCVNIAHMFLGTHLDNIADKVQERRHCFGEWHPRAKITDAEVAEIRARVRAGELQKSLAVEFGLSKQQLSAIVRRRQRANV